MVWEGPRCRGGDARWYRKLRSQCRVPDSHQAPLRAAGVQSCWRLGPVSPEQDTCGSCPAPPASCRLRAAPGRRSPGLLARERRESPQAGWCQSWRQKMEGQGSRGGGRPPTGTDQSEQAPAVSLQSPCSSGRPTSQMLPGLAAFPAALRAPAPHSTQQCFEHARG